MIFRAIGQIIIAFGFVSFFINLLAGAGVAALLELIYYVFIGFIWIELDNILTSQQTQIRVLRSEIRDIKADLVKLNGGMENLVSAQERVTKTFPDDTCFICLDNIDLKECEYCEHFYCEKDWAVHVLDYCENHPDYDPDWEKKVNTSDD